MENTRTLCEKLEQAFIEYENDPLSLVTVIDLYGSEINKEGSLQDKTRYLETILTNLKKNPRTVEQIGWDLPKIILNFIVLKNIDFNKRLRENTLVSIALKCFNEIALSGNAKECFLTGCELLSDLKLSDLEPDNDEALDDETEEDEEALESETDVTVSGESYEKSQAEGSEPLNVGPPPLNRGPDEYALELRLHALIELINTTIKRIHTCYPSRFLATAVGAILNFARLNAAGIDDCVFVLRRIYTFSRSYIPPQVQEEAIKEMTTEKYLKIQQDEEALQRKLLQCLITHSLGTLVQTRIMHTSTEYYFNLKNADSSLIDYEMRRALSQVIGRYYQLAQSFDIDIEEEFRSHCIKESRSIYQSLPGDSEIINEKAKVGITQLIYQLAYTYDLQKRINEKSLSPDPHGILVMATYHYQETGKILCPDIRIDDAIYMYLRFYTPEVYSQSKSHVYAVECCNFWLWAAVTTSSCKENARLLSSMPAYLIMTFLQILLLRSFHETVEIPRMVSFTLLTRLMCLIPESTSFDFVKDTLLGCPYTEFKGCILGILKDLMLNTRGSITETAAILSDLSISNDNQGASKPPLPARPYVMINEDRMAMIHSLAIMSFEESERSPDKINLRLALTYLNFFVSLRLKWDKNLLAEIHREASQMIKQLDEKTSVPELGFIEIANKNLSSYVSQ
ncbi:LANO_0F02718g1_1 [Lachancea nothofagi CBS 11611]|uniref:LANO_0F02718g1_1 n=1 Tax=Lachancea nothofagi CBS 11611 TaxID=1266666 RepID=A0A1G4K6V1_9SACH|nr:LANO_0F02718g1_1 [Lachancea nothofagi CBS 11611]